MGIIKLASESTMVVEYDGSIDNNAPRRRMNVVHCWRNYQQTAASRVTWQMNCESLPLRIPIEWVSLWGSNKIYSCIRKYSYNYVNKSFRFYSLSRVVSYNTSCFNTNIAFDPFFFFQKVHVSYQLVSNVPLILRILIFSIILFLTKNN